MAERCLRFAFVATAALVLAACGGHAQNEAIPPLSSVVLQQQDVGGAFTEFDRGPLTRSDAHPGPRADPARFGHLKGWKARFRRPDATASTAGPIVVESRVDSFDHDKGASQDLDAYAEEWRATAQAAAPTSVAYPAVTLGDDARALNLVQGSKTTGQRLVVVAWRRGRVTASVSATGIASRMTLGDVTALAHKMDARLSATG